MASMGLCLDIGTMCMYIYMGLSTDKGVCHADQIAGLWFLNHYAALLCSAEHLLSFPPELDAFQCCV